MWLGKNKFSDQPICGKLPVSKVQILGVWFSATYDCCANNVDPIINKIKRTLATWTQRDLTIKGRITVAKSLVISQLTYIMAVCRIDNARIDDVQKLIMQFIWRRDRQK